MFSTNTLLNRVICNTRPGGGGKNLAYHLPMSPGGTLSQPSADVCLGPPCRPWSRWTTARKVWGGLCVFQSCLPTQKPGMEGEAASTWRLHGEWMGQKISSEWLSTWKSSASSSERRKNTEISHLPLSDGGKCSRRWQTGRSVCPPSRQRPEQAARRSWVTTPAERIASEQCRCWTPGPRVPKEDKTTPTGSQGPADSWGKAFPWGEWLKTGLYPNPSWQANQLPSLLWWCGTDVCPVEIVERRPHLEGTLSWRQ